MNVSSTGRLVCAGTVLLFVTASAMGHDAATVEAELDQVNADLAEYSTRTPNSKEAYELRKAARDAWLAYSKAKAAHPEVANVQSDIDNAAARIRTLEAEQQDIADADTDLAALKQACSDAIAAVKVAPKEQRAAAVDAARKARDAYVEARSRNSQIAERQSKIDTAKREIKELQVQKQATADADTDLAALKAAWLTALAEARDYLPTREKLAELAKRRKLLLAQQEELGVTE